jgi:thiosulfate reductase cytochrome b subunit
MSSLAASDEHAVPTTARVIQPAWVRTVHWINAVAMILMIMSGWQIYNAAPLFDFLKFSKSITLGGWLGGALLWHFAAMWLLMVNGLVYLTLGFGLLDGLVWSPGRGEARAIDE